MDNNQKKDMKDNSKKKHSNNDQIAELEKQISETKYNKRTQAAIGGMKAKLAQLKEKEASRGKGQKNLVWN